jgi:hypothetical protein
VVGAALRLAALAQRPGIELHAHRDRGLRSLSEERSDETKGGWSVLRFVSLRSLSDRGTSCAHRDRGLRSLSEERSDETKGR